MSRYIPPGARRGHSTYGHKTEQRTLGDIVKALDDQVYVVSLKSCYEHKAGKNTETLSHLHRYSQASFLLKCKYKWCYTALFFGIFSSANYF